MACCPYTTVAQASAEQQEAAYERQQTEGDAGRCRYPLVRHRGDMQPLEGRREETHKVAQKDKQYPDVPEVAAPCQAAPRTEELGRIARPCVGFAVVAHERAHQEHRTGDIRVHPEKQEIQVHGTFSTGRAGGASNAARATMSRSTGR